MKTLLLIIAALFATSIGAEVYRSVDEDGNVVFTDKPGPDSELIQVDKLPTVKSPARKFEYTPPKKKPGPVYSDVSIVSPANDEAIRDNAGNVTVNVATTPALRPQDSLYLYLDGQEIELGKASAKAFSGLDRGTHQLRAVVKDNNGRIQHSSTSTTFHLLRSTVIKRGS